MKSLFFLIIILSFFDEQNIITKATKPRNSNNEVDRILQQTADKLNSLKNIRYSQQRIVNEPSENIHVEQNWSVFYSFSATSKSSLIGFTYQIQDSAFEQTYVYNGTEEFNLNKKSKTIQVNEQPDSNSFKYLSAFYNSLITFKNILPLMIKDTSIIKTVQDTAIDKIPCYLITLNIGKRRIQNLGNGYDDMKTKNNFIYKIAIDKRSEMPFMVLQLGDLDISDLNRKFYIKTEFTNISTNIIPPSEDSWFYTTYLSNYKRVGEPAIPQLLSTGSLAPDWTLNLYNDRTPVTLNSFRGKVVLLDFWIKNCGACIGSIPQLNKLQNEFKNKDFKLLSINCYDPQKDVEWFCNKHQIRYDVLMNGKKVAEKYGVNAYPTFFVLDKEGKIIYSGHDVSKIRSIVKRAIDKSS